MLRQCAAWNVGVVMLDTRQHDRDRLDGAVFKQAIARGHAPAELHYSHRGSLDEPLLWPPDAFVWSYGAGGDWRRRLAPVLGSDIEAE